MSRQNLPNLKTTSLDGVKKGAYVVAKEENKADLILIATGSEVSLAIELKTMLKEKGIDVRVVSMPSQEIFLRQDKSYQDEILSLPYDKRVSIEMLSTFGWSKFAKHNIGIDTFGTSAPASDAIKHFKFDKESVLEQLLKLIEN